jgi:hypothetical protein
MTTRELPTGADAVALRPPGLESSAPAARPANELAVQLRIAAHAGHCEAAAHIAHQLVKLDGALAVELVKTDNDVARCLAYKM